MKRLTSWMMIILVALAACSKDDDPPTPASNFTIAGTTYDFTNGYLQNYGGSGCDNCTDIDIWLTTDDFSLSNSAISGSGQYVYLDLNSADATKLADGTYTFSLVRLPSTIAITRIGVSCDVECDSDNLCTLTCQEEVFGVTGSVTVLNSGETVRIDFNLTLNDGTTSTGTYFGPLEEIDPFL